MPSIRFWRASFEYAGCRETLSPRASVCRFCGRYQNRKLQAITHISGLATAASALTSLALVSLSYFQMQQTSANLQISNEAKRQTEATAVGLKAVQDVLTQVDVVSGGRKVCASPRTVKWEELDSEATRNISFYVPTK